MNIGIARKLLSLNAVATRAEIDEATDALLTKAISENRPQDARIAIQAKATVLVDEGWIDQFRADTFVSDMMVRITKLTAKMDQSSAMKADLEKQIIDSRNTLSDAVEQYAAAVTKLQELRVQEAALEDKLLTQKWAYARSIAIQRIYRTRFIAPFRSIFNRVKKR